MKRSVILIAITFISFCILETPLFAYKPVRASGRQKACFSNQRVIEGAIQMYDMDHTNIMRTALPGGDFEELENQLIKEHYLKAHIEGPEEKCSYGYIVKDPENYDVVVFCKNHGTIETKDIEKPIIPTYNENDEKPFSLELTRKIEAKKRERAFRQFTSQFLSPVCVLMVIIGIIYALIPNKKKKNS